MKAIAEILADIKEVADNKGLKYQLETKFKNGISARVIIRYVKPFNDIIYTHMLIGGISNSPKGLADVIEEEVILEITKFGEGWKANWSWIKHLAEENHKEKSVINSAVLDIEDALKGTE